MPTVTRVQYRQAIHDRLYPWRDRKLRGSPTTAFQSGSTTTLIDTALKETMVIQHPYIGAFLRVMYTNGAATAFEEVKRIHAFDPTTGTLHFSPAYGDTPSGAVTTQTYEIWPLNTHYLPGNPVPAVHPDAANDAINQLLRNTYAPALFPLNSTIMTGDDNDMEASGTSAWTFYPGEAITLAKVATASMAYATIRGGYTLSVTAASGRLDSARLAASLDHLTADPGELCFASILHSFPANQTAMTSYFAMADATDTLLTAAGTASVTSTGGKVKGWTELAFTFTGGTGYGQYTPLLYSDSASGISYWKDLIMTRVDQRQFPTPSWITKPEQVIGLVEWPRGPSTGASDEYIINNRAWRSHSVRVSMSDIRSDNEVVIEIGTPADKRLYIYAMRPGAALSTDTATGYVDVDIVTENALTILKHPDRADRFLRILRESSMNAPVSTPKSRAMAHFA